ncbi:MAG: hypothetical protein IJ161_11925 [Bacteroidales bacterium]|nr:hypothetical protein [Bacteroidales bacterium]
MKYILRAVSALSALAVLSCSKETGMEITPVQNPDQGGSTVTYTMTVPAGKGGAPTKALNLDEDTKTLNATWEKGDEVRVYEGWSRRGTLYAQSSGVTTKLKGEFNVDPGDISVGDVLTLKFRNEEYSTQDGTLEYIANNCDFSMADVTVKSVEGGIITIKESSADFENQQAIVKFTLKNTSGTDFLKVKSLIVNAGETTITVTPPSATSELFVAVPPVDNGAITLTAIEDDSSQSEWRYTRSGATFKMGEYYGITVKMGDTIIVYNEPELSDALSKSYSQIILGASISLKSKVKVSRKVIIDLAGNT